MTLHAVTSAGTVHALPCRTIGARGESGILWYHCTCRPRIKTADPARVLHAGERAADRLAAELKEGTA